MLSIKQKERRKEILGFREKQREKEHKELYDLALRPMSTEVKP